jgi:hypothetical protein
MKKSIILLFICTSLFITRYSLSQWVQMSNGMGNKKVNSIISLNSNLFAGTSDSGIFLSTNNGLNWSKTSLNILQVNTLLVNNGTIYAGSNDSGLYVSTNAGTSWNKLSFAAGVRSLAVNNNVLFAGTYGGVYSSTNSGANWIEIMNTFIIPSLVCSGPNIIAGILHPSPPLLPPEEIRYSSNNGATWNQSSYTNGCPLFMITNGNVVYAGMSTGVIYGSKGILISSNNGVNWIYTTSLNNNWVYAIALYNNHQFAGTLDQGVFYSINNFSTWEQVNQGLIDLNIRVLYIFNNFIFAGTGNSGVFRRSLSDIVSLRNLSLELPKKYLLSQNFPNPFNPSTSIKYQIVENSFVTLKIYNILGSEVKTIVKENQNPGIYELTVDGSNLSSGVYFYRLETENFSDVKKMVLIK